MVKVQVTEHSTSYHAITTKSPHGLQCLKKLFLQYDSDDPSAAVLQDLLARDFTDNENESERSIGRDETIVQIIENRQRYSRHQIDLKRALCVEHDPKRQEVLFEGVRFMSVPAILDSEADLSAVDSKNDWIRLPFSGKIEVRVKENRFRLKDAEAEIVGRRWTLDKSQLMKREMSTRRTTNMTDTLSSMEPVSPMLNSRGSLPRTQSASTTTIGLPGGVTELPAALSALVTNDRSDTKTLPPYPHSEVGDSTMISASSS